MWADTLLNLERGHILRLASWGIASVLVGTTILAWLAWRSQRALLLRHFAIQTAAWGVVALVICIWGWNSLTLRDYASLQKLVGFLWLNTGLDIGYVAVGATLAISGWTIARRLGAVGAGLAIMVQGIALLLLDARLISAIGPLR